MRGEELDTAGIRRADAAGAAGRRFEASVKIVDGEDLHVDRRIRGSRQLRDDDRDRRDEEGGQRCETPRTTHDPQ